MNLPHSSVTSENRSSHYVLITAFVVVALGYYFLSFNPHAEELFNYYHYLGASFLEGKTYLPFEVDPKLLTMADPYLPEAHENVGMWDASLYNGKYYLYFGPVPAVMLWIPVKLFLGINLGTEVMTYLFTTTGTLSLITILYVLMRRMTQNFSQDAFGVAAIAIAFGTWIPPMQHYPYVYAISVAGAYCFTALGFLFLVAAWKKPFCCRFLVLAGLCMGLAAGCRQTYILTAIPLAIAGTMLTSCHRHRRIRVFLALFVPWLVVMIALASYNYARFENPFETGIRYQLTSSNFHSPYFHFIRLDKFLGNLYLYFLRPVDWKWPLTFPPFNINFDYTATLPLGISAETDEQTLGLISNSPFVLFLFGRGGHLAQVSQCSILWFKRLLWLTGALLALCLSVFFGNTLRYLVDFSPWLMAGAAMYYVPLVTYSRHPRIWLFIGGIFSLFGASIGIVYAIYMP